MNDLELEDKLNIDPEFADFLPDDEEDEETATTVECEIYMPERTPEPDDK